MGKIRIGIFYLFFFLSLFGQKIEMKKAKSFSLPNLEKKKICLDSCLAQGPVFISFWALWCKACIEELDAFKPVYDEFETLGLQVLAISEDGPQAQGKIKPFVKSRKWRYQVLLDPTNKVKDLYGVKAMPTSFLIDKNGDIIYQHTGYKKGDEKKIQEKIRELLMKKEEKEK
ncbi:MAG: TlpA disulfide reductase family protein [candidate division WOR-3 bacterium]